MTFKTIYSKSIHVLALYNIVIEIIGYFYNEKKCAYLIYNRNRRGIPCNFDKCFRMFPNVSCCTHS